jgi:hypothetical protein
MKTTTFYTTTKKSNNSKNNFRSTNDLTDYTKILDALITGNVKAKNPYLFSDYKETIYGYTKKEPVTFDITLSKNDSCSGCPLKSICKKDAFEDAIIFLANYKHYGKDDYDFKLDDGTPVKFWGDGSIQIGYDLYYPTNNYENIYEILDEPQKKNIIDIYIKLK